MAPNTIWETLWEQLYAEAKANYHSSKESYYFEQWWGNTKNLLMDALSFEQRELVQEIAADFLQNTEHKLKLFYWQGLCDGSKLLGLLQAPHSNR